MRVPSVTVAALFLLVVGCASPGEAPAAAPPPVATAPPAEPSAPPVASSASAPAYDAARTAAERVVNEAAYREHVLGWRHHLLHDHLGEWIAIAGGRAFPVNEYRTAVRPAGTMEEADAAARTEVPDARHRFVFRIGEEGDFRQMLGGAELAHVLGVWFFAELERPDVEMRGIGLRQPVYFVKDGTRTEITAKGPDDRMFVRPEVGPPGGPGRAQALYCLSTGFGGYAVVPPETAAPASLHMWEIPGRITIDGLFQRGECLRARARFRFPGTDLDFVLPVAIWPERR